MRKKGNNLHYHAAYLLELATGPIWNRMDLEIGNVCCIPCKSRVSIGHVVEIPWQDTGVFLWNQRGVLHGTGFKSVSQEVHENIAQCHDGEVPSQPWLIRHTAVCVVVVQTQTDEKLSKGSSCMEVCCCSEMRSIYSWVWLACCM